MNKELMENPVFRSFLVKDLNDYYSRGLFDDEPIKEVLSPFECEKYTYHDEEDDLYFFSINIDQLLHLMETNEKVFHIVLREYENKEPFINPDTDELYPEYKEVFEIIDTYL